MPWTSCQVYTTTPPTSRCITNHTNQHQCLFVLLACFATRKKTRSSHKCMSFVPAPQQANAAGANNAPSSNTPVNAINAAAAAAPESDQDLLFKLRTFDVYWVDKSALMYRDGIDKVCFIIYWPNNNWLPKMGFQNVF